MHHFWHSLTTCLVGENTNPGHDFFMATVYTLVAAGMLIVASFITHIDYKGMTRRADNGLLTLSASFIILGIAFIGATVISGIDMIYQIGNMKIGG